MTHCHSSRACLAPIICLTLIVGWSAGVAKGQKRTVSSSASRSAPLTITVEQIIGYGLQATDAVKLLDAQLIGAPVARLNIGSAFDTKVTGELRRTDNRFETSGGFSPERIEQNLLKVGASRLFSSGTALRGEWQHALNANDFPAGLPPTFAAQEEFAESQLTLALRQSLYRNFFGRTFRKSLEAAKRGESAALQNNIAGKEDLVVSFAEQYYQAWNAKERWRFAKERVTRQNRLLRVTKVKQNRGTSERPDVLQVESALIISEQAQADAKRALNDIWQALVIALNLGPQYAKLDATQINLVLGSEVQSAKAACAAYQGQPKTVAQQKASRDIAASAALRMEAAKDGARPDIYAELAIASNGIAEDSPPTMSESGKFQHPRLSVAVGVDWTIGPKAEQAKYLEAYQLKLQQELQQSQVHSNLKIEWQAQCASLQRNLAKQSQLEVVARKQAERAQLEDRRFRLGDVDVFNVIQAENDVTAVEQDLALVKSSLRLTSWRIRRINNEFPALLKQLKGRP